MMEMLGLSVPSIIHNQSVVSTKQESTQTVFFCISVCNIQVHSAKVSTSSSKEEAGKAFSVKYNSSQTADDGHKVVTIVCISFFQIASAHQSETKPADEESIANRDVSTPDRKNHEEDNHHRVVFL